MNIRVSDIAGYLNTTFEGDDILITGISSIFNIKSNTLCFVKNKQNVYCNKPFLLLAPKGYKNSANNSIILVDNPRLSYAKVVSNFLAEKEEVEDHKTAMIHSTATIGKGSCIGVYSSIGKNVKIGNNTIIKNNVHIICDKPLTSKVEDAVALEKLVHKNKIVFALTHNYSGYPMLREAKKLVEKNKIGKIKVINVEYPQGYTVAVKKKDEKNILKWRLDKNMCGPSMILAEIGTHAYHLMRYVTGLEVKEVSAEVNSLSDEISVDDNAFMIVRMNNKARGSIWVSSAATGGENGLKIRAYGTKGAVEWLQDEPNILKFTELNSSTQIITRASDAVSDLSIQSSRVAAGHPEGFFEAFANIYTEFADSIQANLKKNKKKLVHPSVNDGVMGIKFIFAAKKSSNLNSKWIKI